MPSERQSHPEVIAAIKDKSEIEKENKNYVNDLVAMAIQDTSLPTMNTKTSKLEGWKTDEKLGSIERDILTCHSNSDLVLHFLG